MADRLKKPVIMYGGLGVLSVALILAILVPLLLNDLRGVKVTATSTPTLIVTRVIGGFAQPTAVQAAPVFANLAAGTAQLIQASTSVTTIGAGSEVPQASGQQISSLTTCTFELAEASGIVMASNSVIEQTDLSAGALVLRQGRILVDQVALIIMSPDARYQVQGKDAVMGIEYDPELNFFWVECITGECALAPGESTPLRAGEGGGFTQGQYRSGEPVDYGKWTALSPQTVHAPTATQTPLPKPSSTPTPTLESTVTPTAPFFPPNLPTQKPTAKPTRTPYRIPGSQG